MLLGWVNGMMVGNGVQIDKMTVIKIIQSFLFITFAFFKHGLSIHSKDSPPRMYSHFQNIKIS